MGTRSTDAGYAPTVGLGLNFGTTGVTTNFNLVEFATLDGGPAPSSPTLKKPIVAGCKPVVGTVTLSAPAPADGALVTLGETLASGSVPDSVTIPAGATSKTFKVTTSARADAEAGTVSAAYGAG